MHSTRLSACLLVALCPALLAPRCGDGKDSGSPEEQADTGIDTEALDRDGDGFRSAEDCDDEDPAVNPNAQELCDGLDNDCDGAIDEDDAADTSTWFFDGDGDGHGIAEKTVAACAQPSGYAGASDDCDDGDPTINPSADETCNEIDDDCDGETDEDSATDAGSWYVDHDGDGFGDPTSALVQCEQPEGWVSDATDCDDTDADVNPLADEVCNGVDDDCDGVTDTDAVDRDLWWPDLDGDGYGLGASLEACEQPTGYADADGDCDDGDADSWPGAPELCDGNDNDCDGDTDEDGTDGGTWYQDADGDGYGVDEHTSTGACSAPAGYAAVSGDCDDESALVNPGATETCNGVDDDCDGVADGEDAADVTTWYIDVDGDGYGSTAYTMLACEATSGWVDDGSDCDDGDEAVNPAAAEVCNGLDDNCDGVTDTDAIDRDPWWPDLDGDGYGRGTRVDSCEQPSGYAGATGDCNENYADSYPGAPELCDGRDNDCDGDTDEDGTDGGTWYQDADGDGYGVDDSTTTGACSAPSGYAADAGDCDDESALVNPGATEICNGVDDDCDGVTDGEDAADVTTWYIDVDGDGYGSTAYTMLACEATSGWVDDGSDCDDGDEAVNPAAAEVCNGLDDNCDGVTDTDAIDRDPWWPDLDGDGYGRGTRVDSCEQPSGYAGATGDCNENYADSYPGAPELCDGRDNDCDGDTDEDGTDGGSWYPDADGDGYGADEDSVTGPCSAPSGYISDGGDCDDGDAAVNPDAEEICANGVDDDCDGSAGYCEFSGEFDLDEAHTILQGGSDTDAGRSVAAAGDGNGDGYDDFLVGAPERTTSHHQSAGSAYLWNGPVSTGTDWLGYGAAVIEGEVDGDLAGWSVAGVGDCDADGYDDLLIGAPGEDSNGTDAGTAYLLLSPVTGTVSLADADAKLMGENAYDEGATRVGHAGDVDGDGYFDLLIGAPGYDGSARNGGAAYLLRGPASGYLDLCTADARLLAEADGDDAGAELDGGQDVDGDGLADLFIGAPRSDEAGTDAGVAYLLAGASLSGDLDLADATCKLLGESAGDLAGSALALAGDLDGDGSTDLAVGAPSANGPGSESGVVYVIYGPISAESELTKADVVLDGINAGDHAGSSVAGGGDANGDGVDDLLVGAEDADAGLADNGAAYLWLGPLSGSNDMSAADASYYGIDDYDQAATSLDFAGDTNGSGSADVIVGAPYSTASSRCYYHWAYLLVGGGW